MSYLQKEFDEKYISSGEIIRELTITRSALFYARKSGKLPNSIEINEGRVYLWEREKIQPILDEWKTKLNTRRGV